MKKILKKILVRNKKYRNENAEKIKKRKKQYYDLNRNKILAKQHEERKENIELFRKRDREYYKK